ncbi:probable serine hydrolase isoform X2 [Teleopsis dalmanni]|uniref:probable serine hydrolase isoform X2 n=1 Tax=Teleopsis dalmanni TaxID=139649 RepID=UPI0018CEF2A4|nr:probable serine hydrolase isoform X2 [Teleopsis dalmanni]
MTMICTIKFEDLRFSMPWGYVVGRWYGNRKVRPILALHGWLDNMGTWNTLIPLLPEHIGILCIDFPGHGLSPKLPKGIIYHTVDYICVIIRIMQEYNWQKVSILSHSMSSMLSFLFTAIHPERVDMLISIDIVRMRYRQPKPHIEFMRNNIEKYLIEDERLIMMDVIEPPSYTYERAEQILFEGSHKSVDMDNCKHILNRNIAKSKIYPDKYYFSRDGRIKYYFDFITSAPFAAELAKRIHDVPYCVIKGSESNYINEDSNEVIEILRERNPHFELHEINGTHHVHLNNPVEVADVINPFINRHRPPLLQSWSLSDGEDNVKRSDNITENIKRNRSKL